MEEKKIVLYQIDGKNIGINVIYKDETFWLNQKVMAELYMIVV